MPCWATSRDRERKKNPKGSRPKESTKRATLSSRSGIGEYGEGLEGRVICYKSFFFIEINLDRSLGMDSNCILVALFRLFFCVICTYNHYIHGEFHSPTRRNDDQ